MYNNTDLGDLIAFLQLQDPELCVPFGFGAPHSDRGNYEELAFDPTETTTFGAMLEHARSALGQTFEGWKGGVFLMESHTPVYIGEYGRCGDAITPFHFRAWCALAYAA